MCGIAGKASLHSAGPPVTAGLVERMIDTIRHRGPDDAGVYVDPGGRAGLGIRRLSIIDLATGHQPIASEDGAVWVVLNGEIYNYRELRANLEPRHRFTTRSDTEVIVHLYEEHGPDLVAHLRGMFALAVWDAARGRLVVARDRLGKKPLYVAHAAAAGTLAFGSELKAVLADPAVPREIDPVALDEYLTYAFVPTPRSIYRAVAKLPAACRGVFDSGGWRVERYWSVDYAHPEPTDAAAALDQFEEKFAESVRLRLESDVPLGCFLSGGLDSGLVTALMARLSRRPVRTFTIGFRERGYDELPYARRTAAHCRTEHTDEVVDWNVTDLVPLLARHFDEPFGDSSAVPTYHVCRMARRYITVALSGDGGDELHAGYNRYQAHKLVEAYLRLPRALQPRWLEGLLMRMPTTSAYFGTSVVKSLQHLVEFADGVRRRGWQSWLRYFDDELRGRLYSRAALDRLRAAGRPGAGPAADSIDDIVRRSTHSGGVHRLMWIDMMTYLPDDILVKVDRMSMAVGLECRAPLLDHRLVEWLATLPLGLKMRGMTRKVLLRRLADRYFPRGAFDRPKQGFMIPLAVWFRGELGDWLVGRLEENAAFTQTISMPVVRELLDAHRCGRGDHSYRLWALLMLGEFLRLP